MDLSNGIDGLLRLWALWFEPDRGGDGRIAALAEVNRHVLVADLDCAWKFWCSHSKKDSLRDGWKSDPATITDLKTLLGSITASTPGWGESGYKEVQNALAKNTDMAVIPYMNLLAAVNRKQYRANITSPPVFYKIWKNPHSAYGHADFGYDEFQKPGNGLFPLTQNVPLPVQALAKTLGALWPKDHLVVRKKQVAVKEVASRLI